MDAWIRNQLGRDYDAEGRWAASGRVDAHLLNRLLSHDYLHQPPPKSTGVETFNLDWLLARDIDTLDPAAIQATLAAFTVRSIALGLEQLPAGADVDELFLCGGGARNRHLLAGLREALPLPVATTASVGLDPQHVEAAAFAWLASRTLGRLPGALASVTGASADSVLGGIYFP